MIRQSCGDDHLDARNHSAAVVGGITAMSKAWMILAHWKYWFFLHIPHTTYSSGVVACFDNFSELSSARLWPPSWHIHWYELRHRDQRQKLPNLFIGRLDVTLCPGASANSFQLFGSCLSRGQEKRDSTSRTTNWIQMDDFVKGPHGEVQVMRNVLMTEGLGGLYRGPFWEGFWGFGSYEFGWTSWENWMKMGVFMPLQVCWQWATRPSSGVLTLWKLEVWGLQNAEGRSACSLHRFHSLISDIHTHRLSRQVGVAQRVIISGLVAVLKSWKKMNPAKCTHYTISIVHRRSLVILEASPGNAFQTFLFMAMLRNSLMMIFKHLLGPKRAMTPPDSPKPLVQRSAQRPKC